MKYCLSYLILVALAGLAGCGKSIENAEATATGTVTLDGNPLPGGVVELAPMDGGRAAFGTIQQDGTFTIATSAGVNGLDPGEYRIRVTYEPPETEDADGNVAEQESLIPESYTSAEDSGLSVVIKAGEANQIDLKLSSGAE
ncbi:MAG: carboxypeptidase-like regulatory domain-containing protein [Planctomycetaceae bacterium]